MATAPQVPVILPKEVAPSDWAQSSTTGGPRERKPFIFSTGLPNMCGMIIAAVLFVGAFRVVAREMFIVSSSMSTILGVARQWNTALRRALQVKLGMITSSPFLTPMVNKLRSRAAVPDAIAT